MSGFVSRIRKRIARGGIVLVAGQVAEALTTRIWNALLARKLGLKKINIRRQSYIRGLEYISIGENFDAGRGLWLEALSGYRNQVFSPRLVIGKNVSISFWGHIAAVHSIRIGDGVMMGSKVVIIDHNHGSYGQGLHDHPDTPPAERPLTAGAIVIGNNVWLGDGVVVTANSTIGDGCIIGANAVVSGVIPPCTIAVGIPAKPIKIYDSASQKWIALPRTEQLQ